MAKEKTATKKVAKKSAAKTTAPAVVGAPGIAAASTIELVTVTFSGAITGTHSVPKGTRLNALQPNLSSVVLRDKDGNAIEADAVLNDALLNVIATKPSDTGEAATADAGAATTEVKVATAAKTRRG